MGDHSTDNQIAKKDNYLKYIATRPRAQRVGSHGLFTGEEDQLVLAQVAEAVAAHPGTLFQQEAQKGNALAMHDLGRMLADGLGRKIDMQAAHVWYSKALAAFYAVERQKKKRYAEYRIGKLYAAGLGCEQDYCPA